MQYGMAQGFPVTVLLCTILAGTALFAGCLSSVFGEPPAYPAQVPVTPPSETPVNRAPLADMALVAEDLPIEYTIKDRSVIAYEETSQLSRDLGWIQGYRVIYFRTNHQSSDITAIRQVIGIYTAESIERVYAVEKEALLEEVDGTKKYEIAFPKLGDKSIAVRIIEPGSPRESVVYSVLFIKGNVFEQITMGGTATDYEIVKVLAIRAADRIR
jgi:hypothetical protein